MSRALFEMLSEAEKDDIIEAARRRNEEILSSRRSQTIELEPRYLVQMAHLTVPATIWKYIEKASTSEANLVMLDLEDSIPRGNEELLSQGRANIIRALNELDWGEKLRFFRPRGLELDPSHEDVAIVVEGAGPNLDGIIYPKVESPQEVTSLDETLDLLERRFGLEPGRIKIELLIESVLAEERAFQIARASRRLVGLIFGSYDYWASAGLPASSYRYDHPILVQARLRVVKAARSVGVPAIAEMTFNYPTRDKRPEERLAALEEFRRDALFARDLGFSGKWTGMPEQAALATKIFQISDQEIERALREVELFLEAEAAGRGAAIIEGRMSDRATDRANRNTLKAAYAMGRLDPELARKLGLI
jgi:citrate lyase beta subunit